MDQKRRAELFKQEQERRIKMHEGQTARRARLLQEEAEEARRESESFDPFEHWSAEDFEAHDREVRAQAAAAELERNQQSASIQFLARNPTYVANDVNAAKLQKALAGEPVTSQSLQAAFDKLVATGAIVPDFSNRAREARESLLEDFRSAGVDVDALTKSPDEMTDDELKQAAAAEHALHQAQIPSAPEPARDLSKPFVFSIDNSLDF
jgi:hypothetical protein